ncbi:MAG: hypothetical protein ACT4O9_15585 [Blastocatellia bacterium]
MLIKTAIIEKIVSGEISLIFRRWKRASVKAGGTQMTHLGVLGIDSVDIFAEGEITESDAIDAGFSSRDELIKYLHGRVEDIYRIRVRFAGEDPRKKLREHEDLSEIELGEIIAKLNKLDQNSSRGNWTQLYLQMIYHQPATHAAVLAAQLGLDNARFKPWVRKLKALGLTESLEVGYRLSPRGKKVLEALRQKHER